MARVVEAPGLFALHSLSSISFLAHRLTSFLPTQWDRLRLCVSRQYSIEKSVSRSMNLAGLSLHVYFWSFLYPVPSLAHWQCLTCCRESRPHNVAWPLLTLCQEVMGWNHLHWLWLLGWSESFFRRSTPWHVWSQIVWRMSQKLASSKSSKSKEIWFYSLSNTIISDCNVKDSVIQQFYFCPVSLQQTEHLNKV